ncbi:MAG: hypothetical protein GXO83_02835 [Chlorobi bacterium]|nr:hypothetical protein [Chlorobiota bacterium]
MKEYFRFLSLLIITFILLASSSQMVRGQSRIIMMMDTATLQDQINYIQNKTRIYDNFRAIREDVFQKLITNALDSLSGANNTIAGLTRKQENLKLEIDSLKAALTKTKKDLEEVTRTKNTLVFLGIKMNKTGYNVLMWGIIAGLLALLTIIILMYKRDRVVTVQLKKDLNELKEEFETYRKNNRERIEKMVVSHHREIQKLKGNN